MVPHDVADGGAGFAVGGLVGQLIGGAEGLASAGRADAAGQVELL